MADPQLVEYIKYELSQNTPRDIIEIKLRHNGWPDEAVQEAMQEINTSSLGDASSTSHYVSHVQSVSKKGISGKILLFAVLTLVLLLTAGGVAAYFYVVNSPENRIKKMLHKMDTITTYEYDTTLSMKVTATDNKVSDATPEVPLLESFMQIAPTEAYQQEVNLEIQSRGKIDMTDTKNPKLAIALGGRMTGENIFGSGTEEFSGDGQIVLLDKKYILK